jgi:hypothetical protein
MEQVLGVLNVSQVARYIVLAHENPVYMQSLLQLLR